MKNITDEELIKAIEEVFKHSTSKNDFKIEEVGNGLYKIISGTTTVICGKLIVDKIIK